MPPVQSRAPDSIVHGFNTGGRTPCGRSTNGLATTVTGEITCKSCLRIIKKAQAKAQMLGEASRV